MRGRRKTLKISEAEWSIMKVLWDRCADNERGHRWAGHAEIRTLMYVERRSMVDTSLRILLSACSTSVMLHKNKARKSPLSPA